MKKISDLARSTRLAIVAAGVALFLSHCASVNAGLLFIGANSDEAEHFAFVVTSDYSAGTVLNFTDSSYGSSGVGESTRFRWTEHLGEATPGPLTLTLTTGLSVGQVVIYDDTDNRFERPNGTVFGTVSGAEMNFSNNGENLFAYQGTVTNLGGSSNYRGDSSGVTSFHGAFLWKDQAGWQTSGAGVSDNSYLPVGTQQEFALNTTLDNVRYTGSRTFSNVADMIAAIKTASNWGGSDSVVSGTSDFGGDFTAVPEPSAMLLVGSIIGAGLLRRRRA
ncbi:MAG: PEP-CTERM sorting domain-containing protein [Planctomycetaceae bacterium]|nr:PEP-CTERM sorting domain-containing protein [Planctomycetaceae bacterium]